MGLALLRMIGIPARYVSGYLYKDSPRELETHAWVEAFVPSIRRWIEDRSDAWRAGGRRPRRGRRRPQLRRHATESRRVHLAKPKKIAVVVTMDRLDDSLAPLAPMSPGQFDVPTFGDGPRRERGLNLAQLEQQQQQQQQ